MDHTIWAQITLINIRTTYESYDTQKRSDFEAINGAFHTVQRHDVKIILNSRFYFTSWF